MPKSRANKSRSRKPRGPIHKPAPPSKDPRLVRLTGIALALPETSRETFGSHAAFNVRKKKFAYYLENHHGDGIVGVTCKVLRGDNDALIRSDPVRYYAPAYLAHKGWVALRLDAGKIDWNEVADLLLTSYHLVAPAKLAKSLDAVAGKSR